MKETGNPPDAGELVAAEFMTWTEELPPPLFPCPWGPLPWPDVVPPVAGLPALWPVVTLEEFVCKKEYGCCG